MSAPTKPRPVVACEQLWVRVAGGSYHWTNAVQGHKAGVWHLCCPGHCGGGVTFTEHSDGSLDMRCHQGVCSEAELVRALTSGVRA